MKSKCSNCKDHIHIKYYDEYYDDIIYCNLIKEKLTPYAKVKECSKCLIKTIDVVSCKLCQS